MMHTSRFEKNDPYDCFCAPGSGIMHKNPDTTLLKIKDKQYNHQHISEVFLYCNIYDHIVILVLHQHCYYL